MVQARRFIVAAVFVMVFTAQSLLGQTHPSLSGVWKQSNDRSQPSRRGDVTLRIDHRDPELVVETAILRSPGPPRTAKQKYSTDGKTSTTTGADGDEFLTSVVWKGTALVFRIEEHEDGRTLLSKETWSLIEDGAALQRVREYSDGQATQTLVYLRQTSGN